MLLPQEKAREEAAGLGRDQGSQGLSVPSMVQSLTSRSFRPGLHCLLTCPSPSACHLCGGLTPRRRQAWGTDRVFLQHWATSSRRQGVFPEAWC